ncbi:MAG: VPLPA-CTERM sorting domain-containing protein [Gammaproteobacteria bacterium]|nr:VPLPA-CTERM sorting domain-containing protein [Gammaproteobacteria bacterium]
MAETWTSTAHPRVHKLITIDYANETSLANPFEIEFKVTNATPGDWSGYSFTFSGLGGLKLSDVLVAWENEIEDIDANPAFLSSGIVGDKLSFYNGAHLSGDMVAYELYFDPAALAQAEITEIGVVQAVPLPAAAWLMFGGLGMLVGFARKRKTA